MREIMELGKGMNPIPLCGEFAVEEAMDLF
jgi:hypothetical protein